MKNTLQYRLSLALISMAALPCSLFAGSISQDLTNQLRSGKNVNVIVFYADGETPPSRAPETSEQLIRRLQSHHEETMRLVQTRGAFRGNRIYSDSWISNSISMVADKATVQTMANHPAVKRIIWDAPVEVPETQETTGTPDMGPYTYGLKNLKIPEVRTSFGLTGKGVRVGHIDSGVDGEHPALKGRITLWKDFAETSQTPVDKNGHGTHTAGTIAGGIVNGTAIGVAPEAELIVARGIGGSSLSNLLKSMQWMLDPDGNPATKDSPRVVSMSWHTGAGNQDAFYEAIDAFKAAGIIPCYSAGNAGTSGITHPKEHPDCIAVAAVDEKDVIASFSSRGPATFKGQEQKKPDWSCPGVDVYSSTPGGKYGKKSGTSMAAPHCAGVIALMLQADPTLTCGRVKEILIQTSLDLGPQGWDGGYGHGRLNAFDAVSAVKKGH